jgi:hypothetical protein
LLSAALVAVTEHDPVEDDVRVAVDIEQLPELTR